MDGFSIVLSALILAGVAAFGFLLAGFYSLVQLFVAALFVASEVLSPPHSETPAP